MLLQLACLLIEPADGCTAAVQRGNLVTCYIAHSWALRASQAHEACRDDAP